MPTCPNTWRLASVTHELPGPAITSTARMLSVPWASAAIAWAPAHPVHLTYPAQRAGAEDCRVDPSVRSGRAADRHLLDTGHGGGDGAHHDRRDVGRAPAGHVGRGTGHRQLRQLHSLALGELDRRRIAELRLGHPAHVGHRGLDRAPQLRFQAGLGRLQLR